MGTTDRVLRGCARTLILVSAIYWIQSGGIARAATDSDLANLSIEELMGIEVTSVSKNAQKLSEAPAAITVLTNEDIRRSGAQNIPDALRMVPGLHVAQADANKWAITARTFSLQYANKLLVMIDGRSVYNPAFSGTYWDVQDVMLEDVDRIEVIRGPGGTLWGANAVNGVINIITKKAEDTQGLLVAGGAGNNENGFGHGRFGASLGDKIHYRAYTKYFNRDDFEYSNGDSADDGYDITRGGMRMDMALTDSDDLTFQGDYYSGDAGQNLLVTNTKLNQKLSGGNFMVRWNHLFEGGSNLHFQTYYDRAIRDQKTLVEDDRHTIDVEVEHHSRPFSRHNVVIGGGYRYVDYNMDPTVISLAEPDRNTHLYSAFVQDQISLLENVLNFTLGSKFEYNDYTGFEYQPSARVMWTPHEHHSLWAAVSRAVRTPSLIDDDVTAVGLADPTNMIPPIVYQMFNGTRDSKSEDLIAYEAGYRGQPLEKVSFDVAGYYFDYNDLRSQELLAAGLPFACAPAPPGTCALDMFMFDNKVDAESYGVEVSTTWTVTDFLTLTGGYTFMELQVHPDKNSTDTLTKNAEGDSPKHQFHILSRVNLPWNVNFDTSLYWVDDLKSQNISDYTRLDLRVGWRPIDHLGLDLVGQNLTDRRHAEFKDGFFSTHTEIPRSVFAKVSWNY